MMIAQAMKLRDMTTPDVETVLGIEQQVHSHPWTRGNFNDALASGNICKVYETDSEIAGYAILLPALDELELLDIGIAKSYQRMGLGKNLLQDMMAWARDHQFKRMLLEVRQSNAAAVGLYRSSGFVDIGLRRGYYPAARGREDAIIMECKIK